MNNTERKLLAAFRELDAQRQSSVLDYVAFMATRNTSSPAVVEIPLPLDIPRPAQESVIKAIKRLRAQYPMLEPGKLLHETSNQMTKHLIHGAPAEQVIDELEVLFRQHYEVFASKLSG